MLSSSNDCNCTTVHHDLRAIPLQNVILDKVDHDNTLCHEHIIDYVDSCPPLLVYSIHGVPNCSLELKFPLNGLQEEKHFTMRQFHFLVSIVMKLSYYSHFVHMNC